MDEFILLHLSDLHVNRLFPILRENRSSHHIFEELINFASRPNYKIDAVVISGDLANSGNLADDLLGAATFIHGEVHDVRMGVRYGKSLKDAKHPVFLVPGNHDRFCSDSLTCLPGSHIFDLYFPDYWDEGGYVKINHLPNSDSPKLSIISADFTLVIDDKLEIIPGGHYGQGNVCKERLKLLVKATKRTRENYPGSCIIWMIHFAPMVQSAFDDKILSRFDEFVSHHSPIRSKLKPFFLKLVHEKRLIDAAGAHDIDLICCGHTHIKKTYELSNPNKTKVVCSGSSTVHKPNRDEPAVIHLRKICLVKNRLHSVTHIDFEWDGDQFSPIT